ncbi:hypothetical protein N7474_011111 [Penicillium riverlandense]|uniref:uncharacterized protein n=1 Tax=Penicillium riverlandense TaxID=1903569 RepID=UPI002548643F|nr:uncharacterized protein N7474_011111 [Penicillium riverlandense]KAJ5805224.1 hypothetical protein N7474_011111 [Penicillium riverlandense]
MVAQLEKVSTLNDELNTPFGMGSRHGQSRPEIHNLAIYTNIGMDFVGNTGYNIDNVEVRVVQMVATVNQVNRICDQLQPKCTQCKRGGKQCGGYRDVESLLFRDETAKTQRRSAATKPRRNKIASSSSSSSSPPTNPSASELVLQPLPNRVSAIQQLCSVLTSVPDSISVSPEELGLRFFFDTFVTTAFINANNRSARTSKNPVFLGGLPLDPSFRDSLVAVGLYAMANVKRDRALRTVAREKYISAIHYIRSVVMNPAQANTEQALKILVMLGLYEMVSCGADQFDSWTVHLDGATALIAQSTFGQNLNLIDHKALLQFSYVSIVKYFQDPGKIPAYLVHWSPDSITAPPEDQPAVRLADILVRFVKWHFSIYSGPELHDDCVTGAALCFEAELDEWEKSVSDKFSFEVHESDKVQGTFYGKYHAYKDTWAFRILNHFRWGRMLVNRTILAHSLRLQYPTAADLAQRQHSLNTISRMAIDICTGAAGQIALFDQGINTGDPSSDLPLNGVFMLLFPLAVAGGAEGAPDSVRRWVMETLEHIGRTMGIQRALELKKRLRASCGVDEWQRGLMDRQRLARTA